MQSAASHRRPAAAADMVKHGALLPETAMAGGSISMCRPEILASRRRYLIERVGRIDEGR